MAGPDTPDSSEENIPFADDVSIDQPPPRPEGTVRVRLRHGGRDIPPDSELPEEESREPQMPEEIKSIFRRAMAPLLATIIGVAGASGFLYYKLRPEKSQEEVVTTHAEELRGVVAAITQPEEQQKILQAEKQDSQAATQTIPQGEVKKMGTVEQQKTAQMEEQRKIERLKFELEEAIKDLKHDLWGRRFKAINKIKEIAFNCAKRRISVVQTGYDVDYVENPSLYKKEVIPELKEKAIPALEELLKTEKDGGVRSNAEETLQIIEQGADAYFSSLSKKGKLTERVDELVNHDLNNLYGCFIENAHMMLAKIGKPAIPALANALKSDSEFKKLNGVGGPRIGGHGPFSFSDSVLNARVLLVLESIVLTCEDIDDKSLVSALVRLADRDMENRDRVNNILVQLSNKSNIQEEAKRALERNEQGPELEKRVEELIEMLEEADDIIDIAEGLTMADVFASVASVIGDIGHPAKDATPILIKLLEKSTHHNFQLETVQALGNIGPAARDAIPILVEKIDSRFPIVGVNAVNALYKIDSESEIVFSALTEASKKNVTWVSQAAQESIEKIKEAQD